MLIVSEDALEFLSLVASLLADESPDPVYLRLEVGKDATGARVGTSDFDDNFDETVERDGELVLVWNRADLEASGIVGQLLLEEDELGEQVLMLDCTEGVGAGIVTVEWNPDVMGLVDRMR